MTEERLKYLRNFVFGSKEAKELLEYERDFLLNQPHRASENDPFNENAKITLAVLEFYQYYLNINRSFENGNDTDNGNNTTGNPTI